MSREVGRLAIENTLAGGAIVGMQVDPEHYVPDKYIPWFERVQSFYNIEFTGNDITQAVSLLVGLLVIVNTSIAIYRKRKLKPA